MHEVETVSFTTDEQVTQFLAELAAGQVPEDVIVNIALEVIERHRKTLLASGPKLRFKVIWPAPPTSIIGTRVVIRSVSQTPKFAEADFRRLPPWNVKRSRSDSCGSDTITCGSGVPFSEVADTFALSCGVCGSGDTRCIYFAHSEIYLGSECETFRGTVRECECMRCGSFTHV